MDKIIKKPIEVQQMHRSLRDWTKDLEAWENDVWKIEEQGSPT